jgi:hypothetical protein
LANAGAFRGFGARVVAVSEEGEEGAVASAGGLGIRSGRSELVVSESQSARTTHHFVISQHRRVTLRDTFPASIRHAAPRRISPSRSRLRSSTSARPISDILLSLVRLDVAEPSVRNTKVSVKTVRRDMGAVGGTHHV